MSEPDRRPAADAAALPTALKVACGFLGLEAVGLLAGAIALIADTLSVHATSRANAVLTAVFAVLGAVVLALGARGLLRLRPSSRTPVVVLQVLAVPIGYQLAFDSDRPEWGVPIVAVAVVVLYLLFTPPVRAVLDRPEPTA